MTRKDLQFITEALPQVESLLDGALVVEESDSQAAWLFPPRLTQLTATLRFSTVDFCHCAAFAHLLHGISSLLDLKRIELDSFEGHGRVKWPLPAAALEPLLRLTQLETLVLDSSEGDFLWQPEHMVVFRRLPALTALRLRRLCDDPIRSSRHSSLAQSKTIQLVPTRLQLPQVRRATSRRSRIFSSV